LATLKIVVNHFGGTQANLLEVAAEVIPVLEDSDSDLLADLDEKTTEWLQTVPIQA
jgi:hypothetical protein